MIESAVSHARRRRAKGSMKNSHPRYSNMIRAAVLADKHRRGATRQSIEKYIKSHYKVSNKADAQIRLALRRLLANGYLRHTKGGGAAGAFKLNKATRKRKRTVRRRRRARAGRARRTAKSRRVRRTRKVRRTKARRTRRAAGTKRRTVRRKKRRTTMRRRRVARRTKSAARPRKRPVRRRRTKVRRIAHRRVARK